MCDLIPQVKIESKIFVIRGKKVILDKDLAGLYGVTTGALNQAVRRNTKRFPADFVFRLKFQEFYALKSQFVISKKGGIRQRPYAFTENGVAMLSSVLNSERAIQVNIAIMRTFTRLNQYLSTHKDLLRKIEDMEKKYDGQFQIVFDAIRQLIDAPAKRIRKIGFQK
ncbi:MAG: ORF6N domain-containing protein [Elusimicrobiota bacterium]